MDGLNENSNTDISLVEQELLEKAQEVQAIENDILALEESCALVRQAEGTLQEVRELEESTSLLLAASPPYNNNIHQSQPSDKHNDNNDDDTSTDENHLQQPQQDGWRVKLYKQIPTEGNWNDCGTGKLTNYYARPTPEASMLLTPENVFRILGEPMLCVRNGDAVLLRTRVLLHDSAYQREGSLPIITWKEGTKNVCSILALSFLDEEGCDDTFDFIEHIQVRAQGILESISRSEDGNADESISINRDQAEQQQNLHSDDLNNRVNGSDNQHETQVPKDDLGFPKSVNEPPEQEDVSEMLTNQHQSDNVSKSIDSNVSTDLDKEVVHGQSGVDKTAGDALNAHSRSSEDNTKEQSTPMTRSVTWNDEKYDSDEQDNDTICDSEEEENDDIEELESEAVFDNSAKASDTVARDSSFKTHEGGGGIRNGTHPRVSLSPRHDINSDDLSKEEDDNVENLPPSREGINKRCRLPTTSDISPNTMKKKMKTLEEKVDELQQENDNLKECQDKENQQDLKKHSDIVDLINEDSTTTLKEAAGTKSIEAVVHAVYKVKEEKINEADKKIAAAEKKVAAAEKRAELAEKRASVAEEEKMGFCGVCHDVKEEMHLLLACGHLICFDCRMEWGSTCWIGWCGKVSKNTKRVYF